jgi:hypothetical protein
VEDGAHVAGSEADWRGPRFHDPADESPAADREREHDPTTIVLSGTAGDQSGLDEAVDEPARVAPFGDEQVAELLERDRFCLGDHDQSVGLCPGDAKRAQGFVRPPLEFAVHRFDGQGEL